MISSFINHIVFTKYEDRVMSIAFTLEEYGVLDFRDSGYALSRRTRKQLRRAFLEKSVESKIASSGRLDGEREQCATKQVNNKKVCA